MLNPKLYSPTHTADKRAPASLASGGEREQAAVYWSLSSTTRLAAETKSAGDRLQPTTHVGSEIF